MKTLLSPLTIVIVGMLVFSACVPASATPPTSAPAVQDPTQEPAVAKEPITISFWHTYSENSTEVVALAELIKNFESANQNIQVEAVSVPYNDFRTKLFTSIAGGEAPDLARVDIIWTPELAQMGALASLDDSMKDFQQIRENVFPGPLSTNYWDGHYYGLPMDTNTKVWIFNEDLYAEAGIESAPTTMDEVAAQCPQFKAAFPDKYYFATDGMFAWVTLPWIWSFGGAITDPDITTASGYLNSPETVAAYDFLLQMYNNDCISPVILGDGIDPFTGYAQDMYASLDNGPWTYPIIYGQFPEKTISAAPFPTGPGGSIDVVGGENIVLFKQSENKDAAFEFLRYILSDEYQLTMSETGQIPVKANLIDSDVIKNSTYLRVFLEQLRTSNARTAHPQWQRMDEIITEAGQLIMRGEKSPQEALDDAAKQIDAILAGN